MTLPRSGVSVVLPTYQGGRRIGGMLESIAHQTMSPDEFELIVVENGSDDGTRWLVRSLNVSHPRLNVRYHHLPRPDLASAYNAGVELAAFDHVTFVDDDDTVPPRYLEGLWANRQPGAVVTGYVIDCSTGTTSPEFDTYVVRGLIKHAGQRVVVDKVPTALAFNVAKLVPCDLARRHRFRSELKSGLDVDFWASLVIGEALDVVVAPIDSGAVYHRSLRSDSHSRPSRVNFSWGVEAKIQVISRLAERARGSAPGSHAARQLIRAQTAHINSFLTQSPTSQARAVAAIEESEVSDVIPWREFTRGRARRLVVSYCFPPVADSSGVVAARRVATHGECVDVVSHSMDGVRPRDPSLQRLTDPFVDRHVVVRGPTGALRWNGGVREFVVRGWERLEKINNGSWPYSSIYSRAMWPASHLLAAHAVLKHPTTTWTAEMSDPLSISTLGEAKDGAWNPDDPLVERYRRAVREAGFDGPRGDGLAEWIECVTYALADEIIFTNCVQRDFMIDRIRDQRLRDRVRTVSTVEAHPPAPARYFAARPPVALNPELVHVGYFGNFYANRGMDEVLRALADDLATDVRLHVFTDRPGELMDRARDLGAGDKVELHGQLPYLDYLAQAARFDVLLVNDTAATQYLGVNPYLPSKVSDYLSSGSAIWAIVEEGSPLSQIPVAFRSTIGDVDAARAVLRSVVQRFKPTSALKA